MPIKRYKYIEVFLFDGVSIFFVLSGFLIGGILIQILERQKLNFILILGFWIRRWFRTLPNYFLFLILLLFLNFFFNNNFKFNFTNYFIFSQNLFYEHPSFFSEAWSLSVEEWFYILIPIIIYIFVKIFNLSIKQTILLTVLGIIISVTIFRFYRYLNLNIQSDIMWDLIFRKQVFTRLDSLMYGVLGAFINFYYNNFWIKHKKNIFIIGIILFIGLKLNLIQFKNFGLYNCVFSFSIISLSTLFLLPYLNSLKKGEGNLYKFITYISLISYSMYLINLSLVQKWILGSINWLPLQNFNGYIFLLIRYILYWLLTIFISILVYKYYEIPMMRIRDKLKVK